LSSLNGDSTDAQVWAAYDDNASYEEDGSLTKAKAFITACRILLRRLPKRQKSGGAEIETDPTRLSKEMEEAKQWVASNPSSSAAAGSVRFADFNGFRD
jgi:hypothetical protein